MNAQINAQNLKSCKTKTATTKSQISDLNQIPHLFTKLAFILGVLSIVGLPFDLSAQALNDDGSTYTINANGSNQHSGSVQDYTIPSNSTYNSIRFTLRGGDGGFAKAGADCKSNGGEGATTTAVFMVGTGANELKSGGTIRFIVGKHGENGDVGGTAGTGGAGGGGTAILYRPNSSSTWITLAAAGGGGGAYQGNFFGGCIDSQQGQGGRSSESGGNGEGNNHGNGGTNGDGATGGDVSGGGGGATGSSPAGGHAGFPDGGTGGISSHSLGGWGFGGGGSGGGTGHSGGGGGGYSGGGGGGNVNNGGGGGSYANSTLAISSTKTEGSLGGGNSQNGQVNYQFNNTYVSWTGNVSTSWTNSANWENNVVPNSNSLVQIPSGVPNFPEITTTINIKALEIQANAELRVDPGGALNVNNSPFVGIQVSGTLTNSGLIQINNTGSHGLAVEGDQNATAYLYGDTNIGNNGAINGAGIYLSGSLVVDRDPNYTNQTDFTPTVSIDNTSRNGIHSLHGEITITETIYGVLAPTSTINIGTSGNIGSNGIINIGSFNLSKGTINIQNTTSYGLLNTAFFGNGNTVIGGGGILNIGSASNSVGDGGIYNQVNCSISNSGTINIRNTNGQGIENIGSFTNNTAGSIYIDQTTDDGVLNTATFNNKGAIIIGSVAYLGGDGIWNEGYFKNFSNGSIIVNRAVTGIMNVNGTFTNEGLFEFGESVAIYIPGSNQVPWAIRNEDAVGGNNPIFLNNSCTAVIHIFQAGIRDPINGFTNNAVILQESILTQVAWASNIHTNNGFILYNHGSFSADNGISPFSISGDFSGKKFWTGCASTTWGASNNWYPNGIPTVADNLVIYPQVNDPLIAVATPALGKTLDLKDGATLTNHGRLTLANNFWVRSGATVQGDGEYFLSNNFTVSNGGTFLPGTSIVTMEGNGNRTIGNTPLSFYDLVIDKSSSNQVTINTNVTVTNSITVTSGELEIPAGSSLAGSATLQVSGTITNNGSLTLTGPGLVVNPQGNLQGNGQYTLYGNFALLGAFDPSTSTMTLSGSGNQFISGDVDFYNLVINKPSGYARTSSSITVANELDLVSGNFNLTGGEIELIGNGIIVGESAASYIYSSTGTGSVFKTVDLNAPLAENPGNIGATISSSADLGATTIYRRLRAISFNGETSILRSYDIFPTNNSGLNATLRLQYLDHELNGNAESDLLPYIFSNFVWADYPASARNTTANWVEAASIASFSTTWTLAPSCVASTTFYADNDGDGYGDPAVSGLFCNAPEGYVADNTDCNDADANVFPGQAWYSDFDDDGYSGGSTLASCERPDGHKLAGELVNTTHTDCDDNDPSVYMMQVWYEDQDDDQYTTGIILSSCQRPAGYKPANELVNTTDIDCDDANADVNPAATETCDGLDNDCDGLLDDDDPSFIDHTPPTAVCQDASVQLDANGSGSIAAAEVDAGSSDDCALASLTLDQNSFDCSHLGANTLTLSVVDGSGNTNSCSSTVTVQSLSAESINWELAPGAKLWPPDYAYQSFAVSDMANGVSDVCGAAVSLDGVWIDRAYSDEVEDNPGTQDGNTLNDIVISADCRSVQVRRERMGGGNGRVYTIVLALQDDKGNITYADYKIQAPQWAWGWGSEAVEDSEQYSVSCGGAGNAAILSTGAASFATGASSGVLRESERSVQLYPNPFHSTINLKIYLPEQAVTTINIFDLKGRLVRQLYRASLASGEYQRQWDGMDDGGAPLPEGMYLIQVRMGDKLATQKVMLQRL